MPKQHNQQRHQSETLQSLHLGFLQRLKISIILLPKIQRTEQVFTCLLSSLKQFNVSVLSRLYLLESWGLHFVSVWTDEHFVVLCVWTAEKVRLTKQKSPSSSVEATGTGRVLFFTLTIDDSLPVLLVWGSVCVELCQLLLSEAHSSFTLTPAVC